MRAVTFVAGVAIGALLISGVGFVGLGWKTAASAESQAYSRAVLALGDSCFEVLVKRSRSEKRDLQKQIRNAPEPNRAFESLWEGMPDRFHIDFTYYHAALHRCGQRLLALDVTSPYRGLHDEWKND